MFLGLQRKVGIVFTLSKAIISGFWTQSTLTHTDWPIGLIQSLGCNVRQLCVTIVSEPHPC